MTGLPPDVTPLLPEPKRLLLEALRSGEYPQTQGALHDEEGYCCLGVLCVVAIKAGVKVEVSESPERDDHRTRYDNAAEMPPPSVAEWATGIPDPNWVVVVDHEEHDGEKVEVELTELNDTKKWTFEQIADAIEESL